MNGQKNGFKIGSRVIGRDYPPYVIAELSCNHNGSLDQAFAILEAAKNSGADAVKLQTYTADTMTIQCDRPEFRIQGGLWDGRTLYDLYVEAHTPWEWHEPIFERARQLGLSIFSTPFDATAVDFLEELEVPAYKVASFEIIDIPLIRRIAETGKPVIISTGMASLMEISEAIEVFRDAGTNQIGILHCTSGYPTPATDADLLTMGTLEKIFGVAVGLSDHTLGIGVPVAAAALGASIIEKHLTMDRSDDGLDAAFSLEPDELHLMCKSVREAWEAKGRVRFDRSESEKSNVGLRRSLYVLADMKKGENLSPENLRAIRPGLGLPPKYLDLLFGKRVNQDIKRGTPMSWGLIG